MSTIKNVALIRAALDGKQIQYRYTRPGGAPRDWTNFNSPQLAIGGLINWVDFEFREAPPPPDVVRFQNIYEQPNLRSGGSFYRTVAEAEEHKNKYAKPIDTSSIQKLVFDGTTRKLKSVEIVE